MRQSLVLTFFGLCIIASCSSVRVSEAELSGGDKDEIRKNMEVRSYYQGEVSAFAKKYGTDAVPFLIEMLRTNQTTPFAKGKVCLCLAELRDPRAVKPLIKLIEAPMPKELRLLEEHIAIKHAIVALGFIGNDEALSYLKRLASNEYWLSRPERPIMTSPYLVRPVSQEETRRHLREYAVIGLGLAANEKAIEILNELKRGT